MKGVYKQSNMVVDFPSVTFLQMFLSDFSSCILCQKDYNSCQHFEGIHCLLHHTDKNVFNTITEIENMKINNESKLTKYISPF